jgi:pSer/pThr/pTyr-binding forkhead associated (FHA) protein
MWQLLIEDDQGATTVVQLVQKEYTLGRGEQNSVRLTERNISRRHARLLRQGAGWFLEDTGSYNGCYINGNRVAQPQAVLPRDLLQLGDYRIELAADQAAPGIGTNGRSDTLSSTTTGAAPAANKDRLVMVVGPTPGREYLLTQGDQLIGRGDECDIAVNHASVSRIHAELHYIEDNRYEIIDRRSSNGLRVNGVDLPQGIIEARDIIELGDVVLKFIPAGQIYRPTPEETQALAALLGVGELLDSLSRWTRLKLAWSQMTRPLRWEIGRAHV